MIALLVAFPFSTAKAATPSEVFRAVSDVVAEVRLLHEANFTNADTGLQSIRPEKRRPRHVLQLTRTVLAKVNMLALINGGRIVSVPPMPVREVTPQDVLVVVRKVAEVVVGLKPIYGLQLDIDPTPAVGQKTPSDVYAVLYQLSAMIDGLGIPATVPNDVYQIADTIAVELANLAKRFDVSLSGAAKKSVGKKPKDVYERAFELVDAIGHLTRSRSSLVPAGGLISPYRHEGSIRPEHVRYALNDILAEVGAMEVALGDNSGTHSSPVASGMTPSDVYDRLSDALLLVERMAADV